MKKITILLLLLIPLFFTSCSNEEGEPQPNLEDLPNLAIIDISKESDMDLLVLHKNSPDYFYIKSNSSNNEIPESVLYHFTQLNKDITIKFNNDGIIDKFVIDDFIIVLRNFNEFKLDIGIISPNGEIEIFREVITDFNWNTFSLSTKNTELSSTWITTLVQGVSNRIDALPCIMAFAHTVSHNAVAAGFSAFECGLNIGERIGAALSENGFRIYASEEFIEDYESIFEFYESATTSFSCVRALMAREEVLDCFTSILGIVDNYVLDEYLEMENRNNDIQVAEAALIYGFGDVQATLTWDNGADLDLHIIDPNGEEIYWQHKNSNSGGTLDVDDTDGYGPENIYWLQGEAPNGNYSVYVHHFPWTSKPKTSNYTVLINAFGKFKTYRGSITEDQIIHIQDFDQTGYKSILTNKSFKITTNQTKN